MKPRSAAGWQVTVGRPPLKSSKKTIKAEALLHGVAQQVPVAEPDVDQTVSVLRGLRGKYEQLPPSRSTICWYNDEALCDMSRSGCLPDKAIDLLDEDMRLSACRLLGQDMDVVDRKVAQLTKERDQIRAKLLKEKYKQGSSSKMAAAFSGGTRPGLATEKAKQENRR